ncbi:MAG: DUF484 family protein [Alphaproteobacteria bacterium]
MGQIIHFEERAVARLRERLGAIEEANEDLIAFAQGHSGAVASIHLAAILVVESRSLEDLLRTVTRDWPGILGIDSAALALVLGQRAFHATAKEIAPADPAWVKRILAGRARVEVRAVDRGHVLFGAADAGRIRAEALVRVDCAGSRPVGLLALGQGTPLEIGSAHGSELLLFLGRIVASTAQRFAAG